MTRICILLLLFLTTAAYAANDETVWPAQSRKLLTKALEEAGVPPEGVPDPRFLPTTDGKSFVLVWQPGEKPPEKWLVSLPGSEGYTTRDFLVWLYALKDRGIGFAGLQWWLGKGDEPTDYYTPADIYREVEAVLKKLGAKPGSVMLEGFSRGSSNVYAVAALDHAGAHYFSTIIANSGGASMDYPPTQAVNAEKFGAMPFKGQSWITSCGEKDPHPDRDGCPAMQRTATWVESMGGKVVLKIEDPTHGHGALNVNPTNSKKALDWFLGKL